MALVDFNKTAKEICDGVRGYYSWPCAYTFLDGKRVKIIKAVAGKKTNAEIGTVSENKVCLEIACADGSVNILELQIEGSKPMTAAQFLMGNKIPLGKKFGE